MIIDGKVVGTGAGTYTVNPGRHDVQVGGVSVSVLVLPGGFERLNIAPAPQIVTVPSSAPVAVAPASQTSSAPVLSTELPPNDAPAAVVFRTEPKKRGTTALLPVGAVLAGVGLAAIGGGVYFGVTSQSTRRGIMDGITQLRADQLHREANTQAIVANVLFGAGGAVAALGIALVIADIALAKNDVAPMAVITRDGVFGGIHAAF